MCASITQLSHCVVDCTAENIIAFERGKAITGTQFKADVSSLSASLSELESNSFALYYENAYPFAVSLFALLHSHKKICIAGNNKSVTADHLTEQACVLLGNWQGREQTVTASKVQDVQLEPLSMDLAQLFIYTSGSSGQPKIISKTLQQLQNEIVTLEKYWGALLANSEVLATVSHQHIYGLLFRVLWPLAAGRGFHSEMYLSPEPLLKAIQDTSACWVASPAQLKRLDDLTDWKKIEKLSAIFSSGGVLAEQSAVQIQQCSGQQVIQVYGSSETGGIAWRQALDDSLWTGFDGINITLDKKGISHLTSPYLPDNKPFVLDDKIELASANRFALLGRLDRIVKVEEKRLSLDEMEQSLSQLAEIDQATTLLLTAKRDKILAVVCLTPQGQESLKQQGRAVLIKQLRKQLMTQFETVVLPRKWLFVSSLPVNTQGKINQQLLSQLVSLDAKRYPQVLSYEKQDENTVLSLQVSDKLIYFSGHFPEQPILPGVTQLAWVEEFGKILFDINKPFLSMEVIKFRKIIPPGTVVNLKLNWKAETSKLYFDMSSTEGAHSSGRMIYGERS